MADVIFIAVLIEFFAVAAGFVKVCDRIIGADSEVVASADDVASLDSDLAAA